MTRLFHFFARFAADRRGAVSLLTAFALPALIGTMALGTEVSYWLVRNRTLQNAADSAAIAASIDGSKAYEAQARAVAASYGLADGVDGVRVGASNAAKCPTGESDCYSVTIHDSVPVYLGAALSYLGGETTPDATEISAVAIARPSGSASGYCLVGLAGSGVDPAILSDGAPKAALSGCAIASNTSMRCNGHDLGADRGDAVGTNSGCGAVQASGAKRVEDPYAGLAAKLPADTCGGAYPQQGGTPATKKWTGARTLTATTTVCGDLELTGNVTITAPANAVLIIRNGSLLTGAFTLQTAAGSGLAIVFTGINDAKYDHGPGGNGRLDITAPTTGTWAGVALYQDPVLTAGIAVPGAASAPAWAISGLIYFPHADIVFKGSVGQSTNGGHCTVLVANSVTVKGTGLALATMECAAAGLVVPVSAGRGLLVG